MFLLLLDYLHAVLGWKIPFAFECLSTRMLFSAVTALLITVFLGPYFINMLSKWKVKQHIRSEEECPLTPALANMHSKKKNTPTMGGILILFSMLLSLSLWMDLKSSFTLILLVTSLFLGLVGFLDDYLKIKHKSSSGLKPKFKLLLQLIFASCVALYFFCPSLTINGFVKPVIKEGVTIVNSLDYVSRIYVPFFKEPVFVLKDWLLIFAFLFIVLVIIGSSNAVNLTDGLDGLASGCLILVAAVLSLFAFLSSNIQIAHYLNILYIDSSGEIAVYLFALIGASLGFLWYNSSPAEIFMGDVGSLSLGGIIGVSSVLLGREILLALIGGIFVMEAVSVILQVISYRFFGGRRIFLCSPLHHHFEYKGWAETKVVMRFWIIGLLLAIVGVASLKFQ